jgi:hypothetical protein
MATHIPCKNDQYNPDRLSLDISFEAPFHISSDNAFIS